MADGLEGVTDDDDDVVDDNVQCPPNTIHL